MVLVLVLLMVVMWGELLLVCIVINVECSYFLFVEVLLCKVYVSLGL